MLNSKGEPTMNRMLGTLTLILVLCFFDSSSGDAGLLRSAMAQARKDPVIVLPKARYAPKHAWYSAAPDPNAIDSNSVVVSIASKSDFYVGSARVAKQELAAAIRNAMLDKHPKAHRVFIKSGAAIQFSTVREVLTPHARQGTARQWKFEPLTLSDVPARVIGTLSFIFK